MLLEAKILIFSVQTAQAGLGIRLLLPVELLRRLVLVFLPALLAKFETVSSYSAR